MNMKRFFGFLGNLSTAIIATAICGALGVIDWLVFSFRFIRQGSKWLTGGLEWIWDGLTRDYSVAGWVLLCGAILFFLVPLVTIGIVRVVGRKPYVEDMVDGMRWRWRWNSLREMADLWCFCPVCDAQLLRIEIMAGSEVHTKLICDRCPVKESDEVSVYDRHHLPLREGFGCVVTTIRGNCDQVLEATRREIYRRIRNKQSGMNT